MKVIVACCRCPSSAGCLSSLSHSLRAHDHLVEQRKHRKREDEPLVPLHESENDPPRAREPRRDRAGGAGLLLADTQRALVAIDVGLHVHPKAFVPGCDRGEGVLVPVRMARRREAQDRALVGLQPSDGHLETSLVRPADVVVFPSPAGVPMANPLGSLAPVGEIHHEARDPLFDPGASMPAILPVHEQVPGLIVAVDLALVQLLAELVHLLVVLLVSLLGHLAVVYPRAVDSGCPRESRGRVRRVFRAPANHHGSAPAALLVVREIEDEGDCIRRVPRGWVHQSVIGIVAVHSLVVGITRVALRKAFFRYTGLRPSFCLAKPYLFRLEELGGDP
mmetsp:Transcript_2643/g.5133  ORF Transcript_2643/g.5133 Transcript_2643/m.5133 type:complete len:335 (-) Transcript_2643:137-1141(-)